MRASRPSQSKSDWTDRYLGHPLKIILAWTFYLSAASAISYFWSQWLFLVVATQVGQSLWGGLVSVKKPWAEKHHHAVLLVYFFLPLVVGVVLFIQNSQNIAKTATTNERLGNSLHELEDSAKRLELAQAEARRLGQRNENLQTEIVKLSHETIASITGGESFCYLTFTNTNVPIFLHVGKHPLYDINVRIFDLTKFRQVGGPIDLRYYTSFPLSNLRPKAGLTHPIDGIPITGTQRQAFNITFSARNSVWSEILRLAKAPNGTWDAAIRVSANGKKRAFESISRTFPSSELIEDVDWNSH